MKTKETKLKNWEFSLIIALTIAFMLSAVGAKAESDMQELSSKLIRLHVVGATDSTEDQSLKLKVRDKVLEFMQEPLQDAKTEAEAEKIVSENLDELKLYLDDYLKTENQTVAVSLEPYNFPTKQYNSFSLPAGEYKALRVVLGEGEGQNWWCVVFPPLCNATVSEEITAYSSGLSDEDVGLITEANDGYVLKFKFLEILNNLRNK